MASNLAGSIGIDDACLTAGLSSQLTFWYKYMKRLTGREDTQNLSTFGVAESLQSSWFNLLWKLLTFHHHIPNPLTWSHSIGFHQRFSNEGSKMGDWWGELCQRLTLPCQKLPAQIQHFPSIGPQLNCNLFSFPTKNLQNITSRTDFTQNRKEYQSNSIKCQN